MTELRDYQLDVIEKYRQTAAEGKRRVIVVAPTGAGKTHIAAAVIKDAVSAGQRVLVLAHRREILLQTASKLAAHGVDHGLIQAGEAPRLGKAVQVASIPILWSWAMRTRRIAPPPADLLVVDECHHAPARTWQKIIASYPGVPLIGLTATPCRSDGRGLGGIFDAIVECPQVAELIEQKHLVRTRTYAPIDPDLKGVQTRVGDYVETQLAERMDRIDLIGDIVSHWHRYGEHRRTVTCAACGFLPKRPSEPIVFAEGDLALVDRQKREALRISDPHEQMRWHAMLLGIAGDRGYKSGWAAHKFKEKFGWWPPRTPPPAIKASPECLSWVRSRNIAWAKARERAGAA